MAPDGTVEYIINSLAWSTVGASGSYVFCRIRGRESMPRRKINWLVVLACVILAFSAVSTVISAGVDSRQRDFTKCQADVNQKRTDALTELQAIAAEDRSAVDVLVTSVAKATTPEQAAAALANYTSTRQRLEEQRKQHPLPQPTGLCGSPPE